MQPVSPPFAQIGEDVGGAPRSEMQVRRLPAHSAQQPGFVLLAREGSKLDSGAVRGQASHDPLALQPDEGIGGADRGVQSALVTGLLRYPILFQNSASPLPGGRRERFGFTAKQPAGVFGEGDEALPPQTPQASDSMHDAPAFFPFRTTG